MTFLDRLSTFNPLLARLSGIIAILLVGFVDNLYEPQLTFSLFYLIPIGFLSWTGNRTTAIVGGVLAAGLALLGDVYAWPHIALFIHVSNTIGRLIIFITAALMTSYIQRSTRTRVQMAEDRYARIVETAIEGIVATDGNLVIHFANRRAAEMLGRTSSELVGNPFTGFLADPTSLEAVHALRGEPSFRGQPLEIAFRTEGDQLLWALMSYTRSNRSETMPEEIIFLLTDITQRKATERQLRKLSLSLVRVQEDERKKFARELHDGLSQTLTTLKIMTELAMKSYRTNQPETEQHLREVLTLADEAQNEAKQIAYGLRPSVLDDFGLQAAIPMLASRFEKRTGIALELHMPTKNKRYDSLVETNVYRIVQELLTNVAKHSGASRVVIQLLERDNTLALDVLDNGKGIVSAEFRGQGDDEQHFGLLNLKERVEFFGGTFRIESSAGQGTEILVEIPVGILERENILSIS
jgi:PAS domain S-box-containing protein